MCAVQRKDASADNGNIGRKRQVPRNEISTLLKTLDHGALRIVIQDGVVIQIERSARTWIRREDTTSDCATGNMLEETSSNELF